MDNGLPQLAREMIHDLWLSIQQANEQVLGYDRGLSRLAREDDTAKRLLTIPGVGEQTATGVVASVPDPRLFKNSRQFAAWLGLVPRQYTTGGHIRLGRITKRGDKYLRMCLVHGARAVIAKLGDKQDHVSCWIRGVITINSLLRKRVNRGPPLTAIKGLLYQLDACAAPKRPVTSGSGTKLVRYNSNSHMGRAAFGIEPE